MTDPLSHSKESHQKPPNLALINLIHFCAFGSWPVRSNPMSVTWHIFDEYVLWWSCNCVHGVIVVVPFCYKILLVWCCVSVCMCERSTAKRALLTIAGAVGVAVEASVIQYSWLGCNWTCIVENQSCQTSLTSTNLKMTEKAKISSTLAWVLVCWREAAKTEGVVQSHVYFDCEMPESTG